jgi:hypothetical protein
MAEFEANTAVSESTKISPMEATKGYMPTIGFEPLAMLRNTGKERSDLVERMQALRQAMRR